MSKNKNKSYVEIVKEDLDRNGGFETFRADTHIYDSTGHLVRQESKHSFPFEENEYYHIELFNYNNMGNLVKSVMQYGHENYGSINQIIATEYTYNQKGELSSYISKRDDYNDGIIDYIDKLEFFYDKNGNKIAQIFYDSFDELASINHKFVTTFSYDKKGKLIQEVNSGPYPTEDEFPYYKTVTDYNYDSKGNLVSVFTSRYFEGVLDPQNYYSYQAKYDNKGNLLYQSWDDGIDRNSAGTIDYEYDHKGRLISKQHFDDIVNFLDVFEYAYDKKGNLVEEKLKFYVNVEPKENYAGELSSQSLTVYEYSNRKKTISKLQSIDNDADGNYDTDNLYTYKYNKLGDLIKEVRDYGNDGIVDYEYVKSPVDPDFQLLESPLLA